MAKKGKHERPEIVIVLAKRIKQIIIERGLVQKNIAHDAGIDVENLRKYIKGTQEMKIGMLFRISKSLGLPMSELLKDLEQDFKK
ncbi:transcriptional regulator with XRE-family HTH domain [Aquimarina sp. EL_43]|uniref:helix-turn-helix domain-containing protein n=1 Tax=Aquimarina TaxID=290174 RepID=UPI000943C783|nr:MULTISPECIES: helix-turn-helix transcriptional regulator [Aquimarina]MBG6131625.1 transcriptional regulator with XRE-family HTH domain [Aquimarina sp. EL_35]MBG6152086.1 transcriptional regulator with XRE-family HTH domain [Aquimarina sp. EL_32]MBG6169970.1 transcriptional regulator with XRE-family HTH domain [Aquimarina sp. EL_43]